MNERVGMFMCMLTVRGIRVDSPPPLPLPSFFKK